MTLPESSWSTAALDERADLHVLAAADHAELLDAGDLLA